MELYKSERNKAQTYLNIAGVMFIALDSDGNIILANKKSCEVLEITQENLIGKNWFNNFLPPKSRKLVKEVFYNLINGNVEPVEYFENEIITENGKEKIINWHNSIVKEGNRITGILSAGNDVTEKRNMESRIQKSEAQLNEVFDSMEKAIVVYKPINNGEDFEFIYMNKYGEQITHYKINDVIGKSITELFPEESSIGLIEKLRETYLSGKSTKIPLKQYKDNRITQWVENYIFKTPSGKIVAVFEDTYKQKKIQIDLEESEKKFRNLFENASDPILIADVETGIIINVNKKGEELLGKKKNEIIGIHQTKLHPPKQVDFSKAIFKEHYILEFVNNFDFKRIPLFPPY